jgi:arabinogalactan oligomer/maltooligosaccharide transport system substrate-binding protein
MADPVAVAQMKTMQNTAIVQPGVPEMVLYWDPARTMGSAIAFGEVTIDNAAEMTKRFENAINGCY